MTAFDGRELKVDYPKYVSRFGVVYETPPTRGCDGPVMGNGDLGAVVFFPRRNLLRLVLNKTDAWVGHDLRTVLALEYELDGVDVKDAVTRLHIEDARIVSEFRGDGWSRKVAMFIDALSNRLIIRSQGSVPDDARPVGENSPTGDDANHCDDTTKGVTIPLDATCDESRPGGIRTPDQGIMSPLL